LSFEGRSSYAEESFTVRILLVVPLLLVTTSGCGSSAPGVAAVKKQMAAEQLAVGDPVVNGIGMVLVPIPSGEFQMGSPEPKSKKGRFEKSEAPQHRVKITKPFFLSVCEVTQQQYEEVMGARPWEGKPLVEEGPNYAATYVGWKDAVEFCKKLSERENVQYRLPSEAEWEYACRAGTTEAFSFDRKNADLTDYAWIDQNAYKDGEQYPHRVGQKLPNPWVLYDMHGNVCEWCQDWYAGYDGKQKQAVDPTGPKKGRVRVWRGGNFADAGGNARSASRLSYGRVGYRPDFAAGFRVVRTFNTAD
jgi:formylglycine-generating enzyme required for sulfatase activity